MKISREDESKLPAFSSHDEARTYFKSEYAASFAMNGSEIIGDKKIYFYHLILDRKCCEDGLRSLSKGEVVTGFDFMNSYQPVEISEDGEIHIVH